MEIFVIEKWSLLGLGTEPQNFEAEIRLSILLLRSLFVNNMVHTQRINLKEK